MRIPILYQDDDLVVVDKPAGIPTHAPDPSDPYPGDALRIAKWQTGLAYLGMHQRLDAETSGVLLFSARKEANKPLAAAFEGREVHKVYLALVHGIPRRLEGLIDAPVVRAQGGTYRVTSPVDRLGQPARTRYRLLSANAGYSLLEVIPETGRSHQIRVHLAHLGTPVIGDSLYGPADKPAPRLCLHALRLMFPHPTTGEPVSFTAPRPVLFDRLAAGLPELALAASGIHVREAWRPTEPLAELLRQAVERRTPLDSDPETTIFRLVNGAADGVRGLTVDRYGDALIASVYDDNGQSSPAPLPQPLVNLIAGACGGQSVYVKYRLRQASRISEEQLTALAPPEPLFGPSLREFVVREEGLAYLVRPGDKLSAGLFPDMREGRARVRAWAKDRRVLNCFAYTCGFGVAAMAGGAQRVLNLDLSKSVLEWGRANYRANGFDPDPHDFVYGDAFDWLARLARRNDRFDLVILDPPGFSRTKSGHFSASQDYGELASVAAKCTGPDGLLLACCNVAELNRRSFRESVLAGVAAAGRTAEVAGIFHEPAIDFPAVPGQEPYLKMLLLRLG